MKRFYLSALFEHWSSKSAKYGPRCTFTSVILEDGGGSGGGGDGVGKEGEVAPLDHITMDN